MSWAAPSLEASGAMYPYHMIRSTVEMRRQELEAWAGKSRSALVPKIIERGEETEIYVPKEQARSPDRVLMILDQ